MFVKSSSQMYLFLLCYFLVFENLKIPCLIAIFWETKVVEFARNCVGYHQQNLIVPSDSQARFQSSG